LLRGYVLPVAEAIAVVASVFFISKEFSRIDYLNISFFCYFSPNNNSLKSLTLPSGRNPTVETKQQLMQKDTLFLLSLIRQQKTQTHRKYFSKLAFSLKQLGKNQMSLFFLEHT